MVIPAKTEELDSEGIIKGHPHFVIMGNYTTKYCTHENPAVCGDGLCDGDMEGHTKREIDKIIREGKEKIHFVEKYIIRQGEHWDTLDYWNEFTGYAPEFEPKKKNN
tara:strand:+ start:3563 stop:3883 length:321 start_codon:yes stop_codon:yes gene_type:complete